MQNAGLTFHTASSEEIKSARVANIPETIHAVRLETPGSRRRNFLELMREMRWELNARGFEHVKIYALGGLGAEDVLELNPYCDGYGVGGYIAAAPMIDYALDIVEVDGEPRSKRGKRSGCKHLMKLPDGSHKVIHALATPPEGARDLLAPVDCLYAEPPSAEEIRQWVLSQLEGGRYKL